MIILITFLVLILIILSYIILQYNSKDDSTIPDLSEPIIVSSVSLQNITDNNTEWNINPVNNTEWWGTNSIENPDMSNKVFLEFYPYFNNTLLYKKNDIFSLFCIITILHSDLYSFSIEFTLNYNLIIEGIETKYDSDFIYEIESFTITENYPINGINTCTVNGKYKELIYPLGRLPLFCVNVKVKETFTQSSHQLLNNIKINYLKNINDDIVSPMYNIYNNNKVDWNRIYNPIQNNTPSEIFKYVKTTTQIKLEFTESYNYEYDISFLLYYAPNTSNIINIIQSSHISSLSNTQVSINGTPKQLYETSAIEYNNQLYYYNEYGYFFRPFYFNYYYDYGVNTENTVFTGIVDKDIHIEFRFTEFKNDDFYIDINAYSPNYSIKSIKLEFILNTLFSFVEKNNIINKTFYDDYYPNDYNDYYLFQLVGLQCIYHRSNSGHAKGVVPLSRFKCKLFSDLSYLYNDNTFYQILTYLRIKEIITDENKIINYNQILDDNMKIDIKDSTVYFKSNILLTLNQNSPTEKLNYIDDPVEFISENVNFLIKDDNFMNTNFFNTENYCKMVIKPGYILSAIDYLNNISNITKSIINNLGIWVVSRSTTSSIYSYEEKERRQSINEVIPYPSIIYTGYDNTYQAYKFSVYIILDFSVLKQITNIYLSLFFNSIFKYKDVDFKTDYQYMFVEYDLEISNPTGYKYQYVTDVRFELSNPIWGSFPSESEWTGKLHIADIYFDLNQEFIHKINPYQYYKPILYTYLAIEIDTGIYIPSGLNITYDLSITPAENPYLKCNNNTFVKLLGDRSINLAGIAFEYKECNDENLTIVYNNLPENIVTIDGYTYTGTPNDYIINTKNVKYENKNGSWWRINIDSIQKNPYIKLDNFNFTDINVSMIRIIYSSTGITLRLIASSKLIKIKKIHFEFILNRLLNFNTINNLQNNTSTILNVKYNPKYDFSIINTDFEMSSPSNLTPLTDIICDFRSYDNKVHDITKNHQIFTYLKILCVKDENNNIYDVNTSIASNYKIKTDTCLTNDPFTEQCNLNINNYWEINNNENYYF